MRCVVDTCILIDIMDDDVRFGQHSTQRLQDAVKDHALIVPPFVLCELLVGGKTGDQVDVFLRNSRIEMVDEVPFEVYGLAAARFREHLNRRRTNPAAIECPGCGHQNKPTCSTCGQALASRKLPMDYFVGAFALCNGDGRVLTRDTGVYGHDFRDVRLV